jgi:hypothetical protein
MLVGNWCCGGVYDFNEFAVRKFGVESVQGACADRGEHRASVSYGPTVRAFLTDFVSVGSHGVGAKSMSEETEKRDEKLFKVEDRRRFSDTGEAREGIPDADRQESGVGDARPQKSAPPEGKAGPTLPEIDFSGFLISLSTQALIHLGEVPNPVSGAVESDLSVAKQMIDILGILREKTKGNLDPGETKLLEEALYDLRIRYVEAVKKP